MPMNCNGLTKLIEECSELITVAAKKSAYMHTDEHPDGKGSLAARLEDEIADTIASCQFVADCFQLDKAKIATRVKQKLGTYDLWHQEKDN